jgi:carboxymethylenebutenolidase
MALRDYIAEEIAQDCADGLMTRREALRRLGLIGIGVAGASVLLAACGDDDDDGDAARTTEPGAATSGPSATAGDGPSSETIRFEGPAGTLQGAWAEAEDPRGGVLVIHENRGLTPHFHDLVARLAGDGYSALCVDLLSAEGGTASLEDPGGAPAALSAAPLDRLLGDLRAGIGEVQRRVPRSKVGAVGFCFGGGMAWNLLDAGEEGLAAVVPFYGPAPDSPDFSGAKAAVLGIYAEQDSRVNASRETAEAALARAGLTHEIRTFPGVDHAFFNDTGPRYNERAASDAYAALLDWFERHLS